MADNTNDKKENLELSKVLAASLAYTQKEFRRAKRELIEDFKEILDPDTGEKIKILQIKGARGPKGEKGEEKWLYLKLKLIADIGIIGLPNAGKSSFIKKISAAKPKIGNYPFTTTSPNLANITIDYKELTFADIPGIIKDAHKGKGLGLNFLSHIERCKIILHLIDSTEENIIKNYEIIRNEIKKYKNNVEKKNELICLTKCDLLNKNELKYKIGELKKKCKKKIYYCSNLTGENTKEILKKLKKNHEKKN